MTLNVAQAAAVDRVIGHLGGHITQLGNGVHVTREQAVDALATLADGAYARLGAGFNGERARDALETWPGALREVWLYEKDGAEPEPWASLDAAQADAVQGWPKGSLLAWRHAADGSMRLHVDNAWTHRVIWPATVRTAPADAEGSTPTAGVLRRCRTCGCTEDDACEGGCAWVTGGTLEFDLCTSCAWVIARDAIASGVYQLEPTAGDSVFEARGGLIPQPMLTDAEVDGLQPLIEAIEAADGDSEKLDAIAAEYGLVRSEFAEAADDALLPPLSPHDVVLATDYLAPAASWTDPADGTVYDLTKAIRDRDGHCWFHNGWWLSPGKPPIPFVTWWRPAGWTSSAPSVEAMRFPGALLPMLAAKFGPLEASDASPEAAPEQP